MMWMPDPADTTVSRADNREIGDLSFLADVAFDHILYANETVYGSAYGPYEWETHVPMTRKGDDA